MGILDTLKTPETPRPAVDAGPRTDGRTGLWAKLAPYPSLTQLVRHQLDAWPDHETYMTRRFMDDTPAFLERSDEVAGLILKLIGADIETYCADYRWTCDRFNEEQIYFLRHGKYRYSTFAEAFANVYGDNVYMGRYVHAILVSQIFWRNHAQALDHFRTRFLPSAPENFSHLEIGPGHGLSLFFAAREAHAGSVTGWELSDASVEQTRRCLKCFGIADSVSLVQQDILGTPPQEEAFDTIVISEVLEHLERPHAAMETLRLSLKRTGRLLINVPINSPAPDHIYLWTSPAEVEAFARDCGFSVVGDSGYYPVTGYTLEKALRHKYNVNCVLMLERDR